MALQVLERSSHGVREIQLLSHHRSLGARSLMVIVESNGYGVDGPVSLVKGQRHGVREC
jgi:predicted secreted protein